MERYTITIARQFGSLGRPIAEKLARNLNIEYYDRDIVEAAAQNLGLPVSVISNEEEVAKTGFFQMLYPLGMGTTDCQDAIFKEQEKIIRSFADKSSCIIVGRCSDYILRNYKNCINVFIYAPYEARLRNCVDYLRLTEDTAKKMIAKVDKARDFYHKNYTGYYQYDYTHKDIMVDGSLLGIEGTANMLAETIREKFHEQ